MAEELALGKISTGAQDDLDKVTDLAYSQVHFNSEVRANMCRSQSGEWILRLGMCPFHRLRERAFIDAHTATPLLPS